MKNFVLTLFSFAFCCHLWAMADGDLCPQKAGSKFSEKTADELRKIFFQKTIDSITTHAEALQTFKVFQSCEAEKEFADQAAAAVLKTATTYEEARNLQKLMIAYENDEFIRQALIQLMEFMEMKPATNDDYCRVLEGLD